MAKAGYNPNDDPKKAIAVPHPGHEWMEKRWALITALLGGTQAMQAARQRFLPQNDKESAKAYEARLKRSTLYNALKDTMRKTRSRPFSRLVIPSVPDEKLPEKLQGIYGNTDGEGTDLTTLASELFWDGMHYGMFHVLVDYPVVGEGATLDDERAGKVRPLLLPVSPASLIGWREERDSNGQRRLTQIRILECVDVDDGEFGVRRQRRVRVITEDEWAVWAEDRDRKGEFHPTDEKGTHTFGGIPLVTGYFEKYDFMMATSPFEDMAWLNLAHWQSNSDYRNSLHFTATGLWFASGMDKKEADRVVIGSNQLAFSENESADLKVVEAGGSSLAGQQVHLQDLEERMQIMGLQPFVGAARAETATAKAIDEARNMSSCQAWVRVVERALVEAFMMAADWTETEIPADLAFSIFSDFSLGPMADADITALLEARKLGDISQLTLVKELRRRGVIGEDETVDALVEKAQADRAAPAKLPTGAPRDEDEEDDADDEAA